MRTAFIATTGCLGLPGCFAGGLAHEQRKTKMGKAQGKPVVISLKGVKPSKDAFWKFINWMYRDLEKAFKKFEPLGGKTMTGKGCKGKKHTPIVSKKQAGFFGAEYARAKEGKKTKSGMGKKVLKRHLEEWGDK